MLGNRAAFGEPTIFVGGQGKPGVTVNLSAIYEGFQQPYTKSKKVQNWRMSASPGNHERRIPNYDKRTEQANSDIFKNASLIPTSPTIPISTGPNVIGNTNEPIVAKMVAVPLSKVVLIPQRKTLSAQIPKELAPDEEKRIARSGGSSSTELSKSSWSEVKKRSNRKVAASKLNLTPGGVVRKETVKGPKFRSPLRSKIPDKQRGSLSGQKLSPAASAGTLLRIIFRPGSTVLTQDSENKLQSIASRFLQKSTRLQLKGYAAGNAREASGARRLSLSRGLVVRSYLIEKGLRSTRIDLRALGVASDGGVPDRVDIVLLDK